MKLCADKLWHQRHNLCGTCLQFHEFQWIPSFRQRVPGRSECGYFLFILNQVWLWWWGKSRRAVIWGRGRHWTGAWEGKIHWLLGSCTHWVVSGHVWILFMWQTCCTKCQEWYSLQGFGKLIISHDSPSFLCSAYDDLSNVILKGRAKAESGFKKWPTSRVLCTIKKRKWSQVSEAASVGCQRNSCWMNCMFVLVI